MKSDVPFWFLFRFYHLRAVRLPPQNSVKIKKLGGRVTAHKSPIGEGK
ncbi:spermidine/putrescine ABC transporter ATP-binding protein [Bacillus pseudomycoides]|uniref:Spermidine/putrescine ABC transporter ATP-binding protein n=1 Tax=Bacillus pseudomycoides TaxID=64104 RepID=A0AAJ1Z642_9BACI|nr:spermidine/putrescine ABC transporter ATP-binding protein [Bacillus pseudomycoides]MDR4329446.1 spermidine/putrescine ABC transporter ATP-binding protein [Bacillus pseudomycoides]